MDFTEQLRILQAAQGNPALLALATVDLAHNALPAGERTRIKDALVAAAVPHWCDRDFLAALLETTPEEGERLFGQLRALAVVEPFPARGEHAVNVHEAARLALREHLRTTDAARWKALSTCARAHVGQSTEPTPALRHSTTSSPLTNPPPPPLARRWTGNSPMADAPRFATHSPLPSGN